MGRPLNDVGCGEYDPFSSSESFMQAEILHEPFDSLRRAGLSPTSHSWPQSVDRHHMPGANFVAEVRPTVTSSALLSMLLILGCHVELLYHSMCWTHEFSTVCIERGGNSAQSVFVRREGPDRRLSTSFDKGRLK